MAGKKFYYNDELHDDFSPTNGKINKISINDKYNYINANPVWHIGSFVLYRIIATPLAFLYMKLWHGMRIKNKKALRKVKGGFFLYGNHTQVVADAFIPTFVAFPKKVNIITSPEAVSIPVVKHITPMLGAVPLAATLHGVEKFINSLKQILTKKQVITIYPEAHIWPYYNGIRNFAAGSFKYPLKLNAPCVPYVVTYRRRKILKNLPPHITVTIGEPLYPDKYDTTQKLHDAVYEFMKTTIENSNSYGYNEYIKKDDNNESNNGL